MYVDFQGRCVFLCDWGPVFCVLGMLLCWMTCIGWGLWLELGGLFESFGGWQVVGYWLVRVGEHGG